jgi:ATP-binding cassette subfamily G (WHITE) protein 2 (PDR)
MILATAPLGCWDNSTRGLDAATALNFVEALRTSADVFGMTHAVSLYQASQAIYDTFDKVIVLYQGKEIFFGPAKTAKSYFVEMGWECPTRQTTGDFLTSVTNHRTRKSRPGYEGRIPRTPSDFEQFWLTSNAYHILQAEIDQHQKETAKEEAAAEFKSSRAAVQAKHVSSKSPYIVSVPMQIRACLKRANQRLWNDKISTLTVVLGQIIMALIVGSVFFGSPNNTSSFFARGSTLFFAVLLNALIAITEVNSLYQQRPIVEKQASYA